MLVDNNVCFSECKKRSDIQLLPEQLDSPTQMITVPLAGTEKMSDVDKQFLSKVSHILSLPSYSLCCLCKLLLLLVLPILPLLLPPPPLNFNSSQIQLTVVCVPYYTPSP